MRIKYIPILTGRDHYNYVHTILILRAGLGKKGINPKHLIRYIYLMLN